MTEHDITASLAFSLFFEILACEQNMRGRLARTLPKGMEMSHFIMLNYLSRQKHERSPAELARTFNLTKGALTNTLKKLETYGYIHIRPDWDDARKKLVFISTAGDQACNKALRAMAPIFQNITDNLSKDQLKGGLRFLRDLRKDLT